MHFSIEDFVAGWVGGICGLVVGHPLDTVKVRQQAFGSSFPTAIRRTFQYEGISGFFKGMFFPFLTVGPSNALFFGVYGNMLQLLSPHKNLQISNTNTEAIKFVFNSGTAAGFFQTLFTCPVELVKTVMQAKTDGKGSWRKHYEVPYSGSFEALISIVKEQGIKGLYRGLTPMLFRDTPTSGLYVLTYEMLLHWKFLECETPVVIKRTVAGGTAGVVSWIFVFPFDVVKVRLQTQDPRKPIYKGMMDCFKKTYKEGGVGAFFLGSPVAILRTFPVNAAIFVAYEMTLNCLKLDRNKY